MANLNAIAVIPARGGSKRLPGKNILRFWGHPMIAYTITAALGSNLFSEVIVSTDSLLVGQVAEWYGARYLQRPDKLASDNAGLADVALHTLDVLDGAPEALCLLMPNCPLRRSVDIVDHFDLFQQHNRSFQISVMRYRSVYPHWALTTNENGHGIWVFGPEFLKRSQDLQAAYCPTGAIWWTRVADFRQQKAFYGQPFFLAPIDANRGIDIDDTDDLELADLLVNGLQRRDGISPLEPIEISAFPEEQPE